MRTSHRTIRKLIREEQSKITDEQLFSSQQFSAYMTDIVETATKRYRRRSKVKMHWDPFSNSDVAHTDNRLIHINAANFLTRSFPTRSLQADSIIGLAGHEAGHILFTDFTMLQIHMQALEAGSFYPAEPGNLTMLQSLSLQQIKNYFEEKDEAVIQAIRLVTHSLVNTMEDLYIEARMMDAFPGSFKTGILLNNLRFSEDIPSVTDEIAEGHHEVFIIINLLIQYAKSGDLNNADGYKGKYLDTLYECIPFLDDAAYDEDAKARYQAANQMLVLLWPYMPSLIEQVREDLKNKTHHAAQAAEEQLATPPKTLSGTSKPVPSKTPYNHTPSSEDEERERLQSALDYETGRIALEKTDEISEGDSATSPAPAMCPRLQKICSVLSHSWLRNLQLSATKKNYPKSSRMNPTVFPTETSIKEYISISTAWDMYRKNTESAIRKYFLPSILFPNDCRSRFPRY